MTRQEETRLTRCDKCGLTTQHEWQLMERRPLLVRLIGRTQWVAGWVCTKCGHQRRVQRVDAVKESEQS